MAKQEVQQQSQHVSVSLEAPILHVDGSLLLYPAAAVRQRQSVLTDLLSALTPLSSLGADLGQEGDIL